MIRVETSILLMGSGLSQVSGWNSMGDAILNSVDGTILNSMGDAILNSVGGTILNSMGGAILNSMGVAILIRELRNS